MFYQGYNINQYTTFVCKNQEDSMKNEHIRYGFLSFESHLPVLVFLSTTNFGGTPKITQIYCIFR